SNTYGTFTPHNALGALTKAMVVSLSSLNAFLIISEKDFFSMGVCSSGLFSIIIPFNNFER
ncbi:MAG: hypothetical protein COW08_08880, partial [Ignavibacteriales bacterium CG12_big_fil_rev_8_21_14_0_65_30_8]